MNRQQPPKSSPVYSSVTVEAPASSANLGPGYDVFALALAEPHDRLVLRAKASSRPASVTILRVTGAGNLQPEHQRPHNLGLTAETNAAGAVAFKMAREFDLRCEISLVLRKGVPIGVGLGSSAASSAAAALAVNESFGLGLKASELVRYAARGEFVASGVEHFDNVAASLMGGFVIVEDGRRGVMHRFNPPSSLRLCLATPRIELPERKTEFARSILPSQVKLERLVSNVAAAASVVAGFAARDVQAIGYGISRDEVVDASRSTMIPGYARLKRAALEAGAKGVCISGAGPTVLAVADGSKAKAAPILRAMLNSFEAGGTRAEGFITSAGQGARVVSEKS